MERYKDLMAAVALIEGSKVALMVEANYIVTPAQLMMRHASDYLKKQADAAMRGVEVN